MAVALEGRGAGADAVKWVVVRFYAELNDHLPPKRRGGELVQHFRGRPAVKDLIESMGVPHTEVDLILVDGEPVSFEHQVDQRERISVYPFFRSLPLPTASRLRPEPLPEPRFVLDGHLGRLAGHLRMLGFDSLYRNDYGDEELAALSSEQARILLTRDRELLKRRRIQHGYYVRATEPSDQLVEVVGRYELWDKTDTFARCLDCNGVLETVEKGQIADDLPSETERHFDRFRRCRRCGKIYWSGSHVERMQELIDWLGDEVGADSDDGGL